MEGYNFCKNVLGRGVGDFGLFFRGGGLVELWVEEGVVSVEGRRVVRVGVGLVEDIGVNGKRVGIWVNFGGVRG